MKFEFAWIIILVSCLVVGCAKVETRTSYDTQADFSALKTYDWVPGVQQSFSQPRFGDYIVEVLDKLLESKGYKKTSEQPHFHINIPQVDRYKEKYATIYGEVEMSGGRLIIQFIDPKSRLRLWEGVSTFNIPEKYSPEEVEVIIDQSVRELFRNFPPEQ